MKFIFLFSFVFVLSASACAPAPATQPASTAIAGSITSSTATAIPSPTSTATTEPTKVPPTASPTPTATKPATATPRPEIKIPGYTAIKEITGSQPLPEGFDVSNYTYPNPNNLLGWIEHRSNNAWSISSARLNHSYEGVDPQGKKVAFVDISFNFKGTRIIRGDNNEHRIVLVITYASASGVTQSNSSVMPRTLAELPAGVTIDLGFLFLNEEELQKALKTDGGTVVVARDNSIVLVSNRDVDIRNDGLNRQAR